MKVHPQFIPQRGKPAFVVLPHKEYQTLLGLLEDIEDTAAIQAALQDESERFPLEVVERIAQGEHPIKVFREYRELTQGVLAKAAGVSKQYISQIENHQRNGTTKKLKAIAQALGVELDDLI